MSINSSSALAAHLNDAEAVAPHDLARSQQMIGTIMSKWPNNSGIYLQLQRLAQYIDRTREELSALRPDQVKHQFLPKATDELDAIVEATASATNRIMDAADVIMDVGPLIAPELGEKVTGAVTAIYEACTFQDITGQRVTKIVGMLKTIEGQLDKMINAMGEIESVAVSTPSPSASAQNTAASQDDIDALFAFDAGPPVDDAGRSALHGPALPGQGKSQAEIDALLDGGV